MKAIFSKLPPSTKQFVKKVARQTIGRLPPAPERLTGSLAKNGGKPVRDLRFRPWADYHANNQRLWRDEVGRVMREIFVTGNEGLPQTLVKEFSAKWADYCGVRHALILPHGTDALRIALAATLDHDGLDYGGEVILPNLSFIASSNAALDRRFGVALVDVDPTTLNLDPKKVEEAIIPGKTRAIMPVHLFGQPADMKALRDIAQKHGLKIVEDAAQAHGAIHELGRAGSLGDSAGFSFQSFKNLPSGEGGALTTNDAAIYERAWQMHNVGRSRVGTKRWGHETLGWNCRATEYVAAVLLCRLKFLEEQQVRRHENYLLLRELVKDIPCVQMLDIGPGVLRHSAHMVPMRYLPDQCGGVSIEDFTSALAAEGFPGGRSYSCTLSEQPALQKLRVKHPDFIRVLPTPVADQATRELISLDHQPFLGTTADVGEIAAILRKVQGHYAPQASQVVSLRQVEKKVVTKRAAAISSITVKSRRMRLGIIGFGVMGRSHASTLKDNASFEVASVADMRPETRTEAEKIGAKWFASPEDLMSSKEIDGIIIATPHWQHAELAIAGLNSGLHVICEKPLAVTVTQADAILEAAERSKVVFAAVHQTRFDPAYAYAKELLDSGELGPINRCLMVESMWRTNAYYRSSPWRATWKGEGGGVLLNQAPHLLDRYAWLCGMPEQVWSRCDTQLHPIEVEDVSSAMLRHTSGAHGYIHITTNECPGISQTTIACDRGRISVENGRVRVSRLKASIRETTTNDQRAWGEIPSDTVEIPVGSSGDLFLAFYDNLAQAITGSTPLVCPGKSARDAVELANAFLLSSDLNQSVKLPLDRAAYDAFIARKISQ